MTNATRLPKGTQSFPTLRFNRQIYVDKTEMVWELVRKRDKVFLARPRRFGKSLLVSLFASLFEHGLRDFEGLAIERHWTDKTYEVVRLDFSSITELDDPERFRSRFYSKLRIAFGKKGFVSGERQEDFLEELGAWLEERGPDSLVVLIDEYDAPLTKTIHRPEVFSGIQTILSDFFAILKEHEGCLRFLFITGITRFSKTSLFSGFNNLTDISLESRYGTLLGYTEEEIRTYFRSYLECAADKLGLNVSELSDELRAHYDGFTFDLQGQTHVYCPWSVLSFFESENFAFENYWFESGGQPSVLRNFLVGHSFPVPMQFSETEALPAKRLRTSFGLEALDARVLLQQTGYLTIRSVESGGDTLHLGYPNREVASSMAQIYAQYLTRNEDYYPLFLLRDMRAGSVGGVVERFNDFVSSIDYKAFPIGDEAGFRVHLQLLLSSVALRPLTEVHNALGRSDLEVEAGDTYWVFELKFARKGENAERLLVKAEEQMIRNRYGRAPLGKRLIRAAMVFGEEERRIVSWKLVA